MKEGAKKVLVIDDEASIRKLLRVSLEGNGYHVDEASLGREGVSLVASLRPDIVLLDLGLPDVTGLEVLKEIRGWTQLPVIVLTVQDSDNDKVAALDGGADDYITKPFSLPELLVRMRVALRHSSAGTPERSEFASGPLKMDLAGHVVTVDGEHVKLTSTEFNILKVLMRYKGKVVTHRMLLNEVWGPNSVEHTHYLRVYVGALRKKLKISEKTPDVIVTEAGVGYRLLDI
ncbi:DNA-binding response regulator [Bdellovibrio bacteriovorus]|uniref:DNA-binding response regulator n=1 Tax=Bdellovibrio bacteriovorus TaxID=959 RepID=A0A150WTX3_BDEBC|nr:response regulator [Bdellovibrio bacteriovorus]KYG69861.1 DNA-binding response regulator [Bdellovibrio bacteriovorus]